MQNVVPNCQTQLGYLGSFNRLWFQMCESPSIFLMVTCSWECYHLNIQDQLRSFKVHMALKKSGVIGGAKASSWFRPGWMPSPSCSTQCACIRRGKLSWRHICALSGAVMHTWDTAAPGKSLLHLRMALLLPVLPKEKVAAGTAASVATRALISWGLCNHTTRGRTVIVPHSDPEETLNTGSAQYFAFPWIFQSKTTNIANAELYLARKWNQASFWKQTLQCRAEWSSNMVCSSSAELRKNTLCESWKNRRILAKLPGFCPWAGDAAHGLSPCRWLPCMGFATLAMLSLVNVLQVWSLPAFPFHWTGSFQTKLFSLLLVAPLLLGTGGRSQRCTAASPLSPSLDVAPGPPSVPANPQKGSPYPVTPSPHSSAIIITPTINSSPTRWSH